MASATMAVETLSPLDEVRQKLAAHPEPNIEKPRLKLQARDLIAFLRQAELPSQNELAWAIEADYSRDSDLLEDGRASIATLMSIYLRKMQDLASMLGSPPAR